MSIRWQLRFILHATTEYRSRIPKKNYINIVLVEQFVMDARVVGVFVLLLVLFSGNPTSAGVFFLLLLSSQIEMHVVLVSHPMILRLFYGHLYNLHKNGMFILPQSVASKTVWMACCFAPDRFAY